MVAAEDFVVGQDGEAAVLADETTTNIGDLNMRFVLQTGLLSDNFVEALSLGFVVGGDKIRYAQLVVFKDGLAEQVKARAEGWMGMAIEADYVRMSTPEGDIVYCREPVHSFKEPLRRKVVLFGPRKPGQTIL